jgi:hypothetical protein
LLDATVNRAVVRSRWFERPFNIGIPTGRASGFIVIDLDGDIGNESWRALERRNSPLPNGARNKTPHGQHLLFECPEERVPCSVGKLGPGIDVRGDGGFIVAPPSRGIDGQHYEVDEEGPPAPLPEWLRRLVVAAPNADRRPAAPASEWVRIARGVGEGERNQALTRLTGHLLRRNVDAYLVLGLAHAVNALNHPPLPAAEVDGIAESICGRDLRRRAEERT